MQNRLKLALMLLIASLLVLAATSCGNTAPSGHLNDNKVKAKLKVIYASVTEENMLLEGDLVIRYVDPMYRIGEQIRLGRSNYEIIEFENTYDYNLNVYMDTVWLFHKDTLVGSCYYTKIDSLIQADNQ